MLTEWEQGWSQGWDDAEAWARLLAAKAPSRPATASVAPEAPATAPARPGPVACHPGRPVGAQCGLGWLLAQGYAPAYAVATTRYRCDLGSTPVGQAWARCVGPAWWRP